MQNGEVEVMRDVFNQDELFEIAEVKQQSKLINWLNQRGIKYSFTGKRRVFSTIDQINAHFTDSETHAIEFGYGQKS